MEPTPRREGGAGGEYAAAPISAESTAANRTDRRTIPRAYRERPDNRRERLRSRARELGPGLITGAADDDPSGIASYSQAGAAFGYATLWIALLTLPLMAAVQLMCARIGIVARSGLASVLREHYPRWLLWLACTMLLVGNTVNIAADLGGMAAAASLLTGLPSIWFVPAFALLILALLAFASYERMTHALKWMTLVLFSYVLAAFLARPDPAAVIVNTLVPHIQWSREFLFMLVAILGTTISPYLFFWQAAQNAEQDAHWRQRLIGRPQRAIQRELRAATRDVNVGMFFSNAIMYFIILTAAATLHAAGVTDVETAAEAASALKPVAGPAAAALFTIGLVGTGILGVPVLAGSAAYAIAEAAAWRAGMDEKVHTARQFYGVIALAMIVGMLLNFSHVNAIRLLIWSAVINGLLAPPLIVIILVVCNNRSVMGEHRNGRALNVLGAMAAVVMFVAAGALIYSWMT
ncbi:MAG TPA: Nramp family divalent metal transporter [Gemmatimonadaceae bacterium]|jgi:NRAMP (natural resistance-associated macrophage protein)-like metal ion transporter|nr:Nramp family divalent metal transporter [Gemmatimonadaceae bacterium]